MSAASIIKTGALHSMSGSASSHQSSKNASHEVSRPHEHDSSSTESSPSLPSTCGCVNVNLRAERLSAAYPSLDTLLYGKGKDVLTFHDCDEDDGFVFGSKQGEYCLLRIRIENSPESPSVLIDSIVDVQMVYQGGGTVNPKMAETQQQSHLKEVVVLLEPETLQRKVTSGSSDDIVRAGKRDARFQLHVQVSLAESDKLADIAKIVCWRTVKRTKSSLWQRGYAAGQRAWKRLSHVQCLAPRTKDATRPIKTKSKARRKNRQGASNSELSWRTCFESIDKNLQYLDSSTSRSFKLTACPETSGEND